jgi:hypothetical protein
MGEPSEVTEDEDPDEGAEAIEVAEMRDHDPLL